MIRLPDLPTVPQQSLGAPAMSAQAAAAPAQALGHVAESIASVSGHFYDHAVKIQRMENARQISEARNSLATAYAQHQIDLQSDLDPASRMEKTRAFIAGAQQFIPADAPPEVQDQLGEFLSDWSTKAEISQAEDSSRLAIRRSKAAFKNEIDTAEETMDRDKLSAAIDNAVAGGLIYPEEGEPIVRNFDRKKSLAQIDEAIREEPSLVAADVEKEDFLTRFPSLHESDLKRIRSATKTSIQYKRAEELDLIQEALNNGTLNPDDLKEAKYLTPKDIAAVNKAIAKSAPPSIADHTQAQDILFTLRDDYKNPSVSDQDYAKKWNNARVKVMQMFPSGLPGDISQELSYRSWANRSAEKQVPDHEKKPEARNTEYKSLINQRIKKAYDDGLLGDIKDPKSKDASQAFSRLEDAKIAVSEWMARNPQASYPEIREAAQKILGTTLTDSAPLITLPAIPPPVTFDTRAAAILPQL